MYKNFNLTESEREEILNSHKEHGYKQPLNEQKSDRMVSDDNMDAGNLEITHAGCYPQHWVVDVNLSNDNGEEDSTTVHVMTSGDEVVSVTCDDDDNLHSSISSEQAEEFVKQKIADGTLNFPPYIGMEGNKFY